ncbi:hypothetical protein MMC30_006470 [Trapelia coarctata]|nr:hypothetical protein [Trapelia coarctata]
MLAYTTEHKYTDANSHLDRLKGRDRATVQCLRYACEKQGFCLFLANLEHTIVGGYSRGYYYGDNKEDESEGWKDNDGDEGISDYHEIGDVYETYLKLKTVFSASGLKIAEDVPIKETDIAQVEPFARNPDKEDYSGYTASRNSIGNDGDLKRLRDWRFQNITSILAGNGIVYKEDGQALIEIAKICEDKDLFQILLPFANKHISSNSGFFVAFLTKLFIAGKDGKISTDVVSNNVLDLYIRRFVDIEPTRPCDWKRSPSGCGCGDCTTVNRFLIDLTQKVGRFPLAEKRRRHVQNKLGSNYDTDTVCSGSPYTLVVTKTETEYREAWKTWQERFNEAKDLVSSLGLPALTETLGNRHEELTSFTSNRAATANPVRAPLSSTPQAQGARTERPKHQALIRRTRTSSILLEENTSTPCNTVDAEGGACSGPSCI